MRAASATNMRAASATNRSATCEESERSRFVNLNFDNESMSFPSELGMPYSSATSIEVSFLCCCFWTRFAPAALSIGWSSFKWFPA